MKRKRLPTYSPNTTYFLTTTVTEFTHIFQRQELAQIILDNLRHYVQESAIKLHAFIIMPNHIHLLLTMGEKRDVSLLMGRLKGYSAKQIIQWCEQHHEKNLLDIFASAAKKYKQPYTHQVWQERFDDLVVNRETLFSIKLNYIHNNPLQERWHLCDRAELYKFSSARYYVNNEDAGVPITEAVL